MIDRAQSDRLRMLRLPLIAGVVFIHASTLPPPGSGAYTIDAKTLAQLLLSDGVARLAVPIFFLMAGFFLYGHGAWSSATYLEKLKARAWTLLLPMVLWNALSLGLFAAAQAHPATARYFSGSTVIANFGPMDYGNALLGVSALPIAHQFWFIRDLIVMVIVSPLLLLAVKAAPKVTLALMASLWLLTAKPYPIPAPEAALFFSVGLFCRARGLSLFSLDGHARFLLWPYLLLLLATPAYLGQPYGLALRKLEIALGVPVALWLTGLGSPSGKARAFLLRFAAASFFIFAAHEPLLTIVKKLLPSVISAPLAVYLLAPVIVIVTLLLSHAALHKLSPRLMRLLAGSR
jgi:surface polysaccharide O-acyltransferase-like enzyme